MMSKRGERINIGFVTEEVKSWVAAAPPIRVSEKRLIAHCILPLLSFQTFLYLRRSKIISDGEYERECVACIS